MPIGHGVEPDASGESGEKPISRPNAAGRRQNAATAPGAQIDDHTTPKIRLYLQITPGKSAKNVPKIPGTTIPDPAEFNRLKVSDSTSKQKPNLDTHSTNLAVQRVSVAQAVYVDPAPTSFVTRTNGQLQLAGRRYFGAGANNYGLAAQKEVYNNATYLRELFDAYKSEGVNVLRIWYVYVLLLHGFKSWSAGALQMGVQSTKMPGLHDRFRFRYGWFMCDDNSPCIIPQGMERHTRIFDWQVCLP